MYVSIVYMYMYVRYGWDSWELKNSKGKVGQLIKQWTTVGPYGFRLDIGVKLETSACVLSSGREVSYYSEHAVA